MAGRFITPDTIERAGFDQPTLPRLIGYDYLPKDPPVFALAKGKKANHTGNALDPAKLNTYACAANNPVNLVDPLGYDYDLVLKSAKIKFRVISRYRFRRQPGNNLATIYEQFVPKTSP
ncbi:MAG: hypothetical protein ABSG91_12130 [Syntrophobacteraceae bacterium]|jgi:hypothetical protein